MGIRFRVPITRSGLSCLPPPVPHRAVPSTLRIKGLAVTAPERLALLPDVPTMVELGYPDMVASSWQGILAPTGTPRDVVAKLHGALKQTMETPDVRQRLSSGGAVATTSKTPEEFAEFLASETRRWAKVARDSGAEAD